MDQLVRPRGMTPPRRARSVWLALTVGIALVAVVAPSTLSASTVTRGDLAAFATAAGQPIAGRAQMVRTADGRTIVTLHVEGLAPNTTYASHVHAAACAVGDADGHYKFDPAGAATPPNEIWPGPFTTNELGIGNANTIAAGTAGPGAGVRLRDVLGSLVRLTLQQRDAARARRDYATADAIRDGLDEIGVQVEDTPEGPRWELKR